MPRVSQFFGGGRAVERGEVEFLHDFNLRPFARRQLRRAGLVGAGAVHHHLAVPGQPRELRLDRVEIHGNGGADQILINGTLSAGSPASGAGMVKMSFRYICTGSSTFSPSRNAGVGAVGPAMMSTSAKQRRKSSAIRRRAFWAFR